MKKIKKFKVNLRKREILRNLKLISEIKEITPQIEEIIDEEIKSSTEYISPAAVFDTLDNDGIIIKFGKEFFPPDQKKPLLASFIAVTAGAQIEEEITRRQESGETIRALIVKALGLEACESALNFILKLIADDAKKEESALLSPEKLEAARAVKVIAAIEAKKIGIYVNDKGQVQPEFTSVAAVRWK